MAKKPSKSIIKVGVIGIGRGQSYAAGAGENVGMKLVALCDIWEERLNAAGKKYGVATYTDYDKFLEHDMDAVVLANYFHQHAPFAIKALKAGKHVMSETSANATLADGVALCRAVEKSGKIYMFAENYPFTCFNQELRRVYKTGEIGRVLYAEGEYNHPMDSRARLHIAPGQKHWRNYLPSTYYCTHALAPLMYITESTPTSVIGLSVAAPECNKDCARLADPTSVILTQNDDGSVFRIFGLLTPGHSNWYRVHGSKGAMEIERGVGYFGTGRIRVWHEDWDRVEGKIPAERCYAPDWPELGDLARRAGHGGGDFWVNYHFANAIRSGRPHFLDVYRGVTMSSVGILAWRSALAKGDRMELPDFRSESSRKKFANDHWSPWPDGTGDGKAPPSILGRPKLDSRRLALARKEWKAMGYKGADF
ncbi:MAG: Gfo/Idh/MocA family oxidoreductase [Phycisphaeraceae bacterium]|nr:Gfo/Idh/MocA family oxidoreductase [Phycisphaeraceae bacterium]